MVVLQEDRDVLCYQGKDMLMVLQNDTMNLIDPLGQTLLHSQPIASIRVWGVGRDNGRSVSTRTIRRCLAPHLHYCGSQLSGVATFTGTENAVLTLEIILFYIVFI